MLNALVAFRDELPAVKEKKLSGDSGNFPDGFFRLNDLVLNDRKFKEISFKQCPYVFRDKDKCSVDALKEHLCDFDILELLKHTASDQIHVWLSNHSTNVNKSDTKDSMQSIMVDDASTAMKLYNSGQSLYCRAPLELEQNILPHMFDTLGIGLNGSSTDKYRRGEIELFFSRAGHKTDFHLDFQENFTIQLKGTKKWTFRNSSAVEPLRGCTPHFEVKQPNGTYSDVSELQLKVLRLGDPMFTSDQFRQDASVSDWVSDFSKQEVVLYPGDILYHPAGIWHKVEAEEDSISMNVSLMVASYAEVFCSGLQQLILEDSKYRAPVLGGSSSNREQAKLVIKSLLDTLPILLQKLQADDFIPLPCSVNSNESDKAASDKDDADEDDDSSLVNQSSSFQSYNTSPAIYVQHQIVSDSITRKILNRIDIRFRINPLALLINNDDLDRFMVCDKATTTVAGDDEEDVIYVCHFNYGNENFDSLLRQEVIIPSKYVHIAKVLGHLITNHQLSRKKYYLRNEELCGRKRRHSGDDDKSYEDMDDAWSKTECFSYIEFNTILKKDRNLMKHSDADVIKLLLAFVNAGVLTIKE